MQAGQPRSSCVSQSLTILHVVALEGGEHLAAGAEHQPALLVSDRGVQYASHDYVALLEAHQVRISMSRRGNPWDNATCESFMKTLKCEEVYNQKRLHSSLGYCPPSEFERLQSSPRMLTPTLAEAI